MATGDDADDGSADLTIGLRRESIRRATDVGKTYIILGSIQERAC